MLSDHLCKTTTIQECVLREETEQKHRLELRSKVSDDTFERVYHNLLQCDSSLQIEWDEQPFELKMKRSPIGLYLVELTIDHQPYRFVIDTGAQICALRPSVAEAHQAKRLPGKLAVGSIGGKEKNMHGYLLDEIKLGTLTIRNLPVVALETTGIAIHGKHKDYSLFDGILGWDILSQLDFELDDVGHRFKILKNRYRFPYPNMVKAVFPIFLMKDEQGRILTMGFDSGARRSWMNQERMQELDYPMSKERSALGFGVHGLEEMSIRTVANMHLYLYKASIQMRRIHTGRTDIFPNICLDGIVGNEIFRNRRIRIINSIEMVLLA